ncbi:MAG: 50S ribosomal protein L4 [Clostridiales bacterium]|nr:50S ribosomal protein L4 [Clostridiales bacterium]MDD7310126.1 50S ribosomal protein L4 [Eubacteriales bacterium]MDY5346955.1 50S ribosomal protein L4 [Eubacteriales bacterium]
MKTTVYDMNGNSVGEIELNDAIFALEPNVSVMHTVVKNYLANQRQGTQSALTRSEVSGGGAKPYRQKGTGRARQGSTRAPQWTHGGVAFAPKPRSYRYTVNKKVRKLAIKSALSTKASAQKLIVIDAIKFDAPKTKAFAAFMSAVNASAKSLVVTAAPDQNVALSGRNLPGVKTTMANMINTYDILKYDTLVVDKASLTVIEEVFA